MPAYYTQLYGNYYEPDFLGAALLFTSIAVPNVGKDILLPYRPYVPGDTSFICELVVPTS